MGQPTGRRHRRRSPWRSARSLRERALVGEGGGKVGIRCGEVMKRWISVRASTKTRSRSMLFHRRQQAPSPGIGRELQGRVPEDADQPGLHSASQIESDARRRGHQTRLGLVEPGKQATFTTARALQEVAEPEQRLTGPGSPSAACWSKATARPRAWHRARPHRSPLPRHGLLCRAAPADDRLQPRVHREAILGDPKLVCARHMTPAAQLEHFQLPDMAGIKALVGQHQHPVDMGAEDLELIPGMAGRGAQSSPRALRPGLAAAARNDADRVATAPDPR